MLVCWRVGASILANSLRTDSNAWRNDLQHPNEYVRGATLRFLCSLREPELLEPLVPSVRACLVCAC